MRTDGNIRVVDERRGGGQWRGGSGQAGLDQESGSSLTSRSFRQAADAAVAAAMISKARTRDGAPLYAEPVRGRAW